MKPQRPHSHIRLSLLLQAALFMQCAFSCLSHAEQLTHVPITQGRLKILLTSSAQCSWGDLDLISLDLREHRQKNIPTRLLVSVEALDGSMASTVEIDIRGFVEGAEASLPQVVLPLTKVRKGTPVGIFVCKDSVGEGRCRTKKIEDFDGVLARHIVELRDGVSVDGVSPDRVDPTTAGDDVVYFFQPAILTSDGLSVVTEDFTKESLSAFERELEARYGADSSSIAMLRHGVTRVRSGLVMVPSSGITIDLPSSDQSKCIRELAEKVETKK